MNNPVPEKTTSFLRLESDMQELECKLGEKLVYVIGRTKECDVCIDSSLEVSRKHAEIKKSGDETYQIRDLGSKNGTYVNGTKIGDNYYPLKNDDKVRLGLHIFFVFKRGLS